MKHLGILKVAAVFLLLFLSLFNYSREARSDDGRSTSSLHVDGAALDAIILGFVAIFSAWGLTDDIKRVSTRFGLPAALPAVPYQSLPFLLALSLPFMSGSTRQFSADGASIKVTSGWGQSSFTFLVLLILVILVYLAKVRKRLLELESTSSEKSLEAKV